MSVQINFLMTLLLISSVYTFDLSKVLPLHITPKYLPDISYSNVSEIGEKIVGGFEVQPHSLPYQVGLALNIGSRTAWCGGSLISEQFIVTAAHCAVITKNATVYLGAHNVKNDSETTQIRIQVPKNNIIVHEKWSRWTLSNDIALFKLPEPVSFNDNIQPISLPSKKHENDKFVGETVLASGWGKDSDKSKGISPVLRAVENPVISKFWCTLHYFGIIRNTHICMSGRPSKSTCNGDSGGPLAHEEPNGSKILVGVTSFGIAFGCEKNWPAVFTRVTSYLDWISEKTGIKIKS